MKSKKSEQAFATRDRLLKSALKIFSKKGFASASIREIVEDSRTTLPSIYYHFGNKEGLYQALMREHFSVFESLMKEFKQTGSAREKIKSFISSLYLYMVENVEFFRLMQIVSYGPPESAPPSNFGTYRQKFQDFLTAKIEDGIKNGEFRPGNVDDMTWALHGTVQAAAEELCFNLSGGFNPKRLERVLDIILDGFSTEKRS